MHKTLFAGQFQNSSIKESFCNGRWAMEFSGQDICACLAMYDLEALEQQNAQHYYGGHAVDEVLDAGKDILGEEVLQKGEPEYQEIKSLLPRLHKGAFAFLSGALSWGSVIVHADSGVIYPQNKVLGGTVEPLFEPTEIDAVLGTLPPKLCLLDGYLPIIFSVHHDDSKILELMYFVEAGDPGRDPMVWIRSKKYQKDAPESAALQYAVVAAKRHEPFTEIAENMFWEALCNTVGYWLEFCETGAAFRLPEEELQKVVHGTQISCAATFSGDHGHYGHNIYSEEIHDNFPPVYIWTVEMCCLTGRTAWARRIWEHMLTYVLSFDGQFCYRQGEKEVPGASAGDYAYLLFLAGRYYKQLGADRWDDRIWKKITQMGEVLLRHCKPYGASDCILVQMCAEADTNTRIHAYVSNNLWTIRGLEALAALLQTFHKEKDAARFGQMAQVIRKSVEAQIAKESIWDDRFGKLPPFRFGYTAAPETLSICRDTFSGLEGEAYETYLQISDMREQGSDQDLTENSFANYRYYPEMLSAMLLDERQAAAIVRLREQIGGEILGMTRFRERLDDWPVLHYGRYLLESGRTDKYLMLLYAHTCHHGRPDLMCYYEQVTAEGSVYLDDCVPSLLTVPMMIGWMFAYETMDAEKLMLLAGIPKSWYAAGCAVKGIGTTFGTVDIAVQEDGVSMVFAEPLPKSAEMLWRVKDTLNTQDILSGMEAVETIIENRIILKKGIVRADIRIRMGAESA